MYQRTQYCSQFQAPCIEPEPFASLIDVITASQSLEVAIHAKGRGDTLAALNNAQKYLDFAKHYFETANIPTMVARVQNVITELDTLIQKTKQTSSNQFSKFQEQTLYGFMGVLAALYRDIRVIGP